MRLFSTSLFALACASIAFASESAEPASDAPSDVVVLTTSTFSKFVADESLSLIEFYAPWCGHCKALAPEYEIAATTLKKSNIPIAKIDCTVEKEVCEEQGVKGYPTLKVFRDGNASDYKGARKADGIISAMKKQALPSVNVVSAEKIQPFIDEEKVVVVGFFNDDKSKAYREFIQVGEAIRDDFVTVASFDEKALKEYDTVAPSVILYKQFDDRKVVYKGDFKQEDVIAFVKANAVPLMDEIGPDNYSNYVERGLPIAYLFYSSEAERSSLGAEVEKVAADYKGKVSFVYIDAVKYGGHANSLNLKQEWPQFGIQEAKADLKFPFDGEINQKNIAKFLKAYTAGEISPSLKSAAVPETNDEPVKVLVGTTYDESVFDKTKDVFVELYAPWCGHCQKLAPIWDELAAKLKDSGIVIAKMDATENDVPPKSGFRVEGFPTLKLYKAESNTIVDYSGDRSLEDLLKFLKENAVNGKAVDAAAEAAPAKEAATESASATDAAETEAHDEL